MRGKANLVKGLLCVLFLTWPVQAKYGGGSGTAEDPYLINTAEQMNAIGANWDDWDKHFKLMADIDLSSYTGTDFNIIGIGTRNAFTGVFDGNGKKISNFSYASTNGGYKGLFRYVSGENAQIKDLGLIAPNIDAGTGSCVGSLVGYVSAGTITNCYAEGGSVSGKRWVGGMVGYNWGEIKDCYSTGDVSGDERVGGLVGDNGGSITNCSVTGNVGGSDDVGGLVGDNSGSITNCSATGSVAGDDRDVGGLVGYNTGPITNCSAGGDVLGSGHVGGLVGSSGALITDCYALGTVSGDDYVGGLVGIAYDSIANCYAIGGVSGTTYVGGLVGLRPQGGTVLNSFWDIETSGQSTSDGGTGRTTAEMLNPNTFVDASWDFVGAPDGPADIWAEPDGGGYPVLWWQLSPLPELPTFSGGTGEPDEPYLISTADELNSIGHNPRLMAAHFKLINDIDLADVNFFIIGGQWHPFRGTFDGNGHTISNFSYNSAYATCVGLFGYVAGAQIKDLGLVGPNVEVERGDFHSSLVGHLDGGTITNCYVEAGSVSGNDCVGGLVGWNGGDWSGRGTITNCYVTGAVGGDDDVGGLVGSNEGAITDCYAMADVSGNNRVGGLVGASDNVSSSRGGGRGGPPTVWPSVERCYATGSVTGDESVGGLVGRSTEEITRCFWDTETSGQSTSAGGVGRTTAQMQTANTFVGWGAFGNEGIWTIDEGNDYPRLWWENMPGEPLTTAFYGGGFGTEADPYLIYTAEELNMIGVSPWDWDKRFKLMEDIDLAAYTGTDFNIIGYYISDDDKKPFTGVFDGNGKTISNFSYTSTDVNNIGLFGYVKGSRAKVKDLGLIETNISGTGGFVGSLVGLLSGRTITGCYAEGGSVSGYYGVGGLVGWNWGGTITDCYATVSVSGGEEVGGLVGQNGYFYWPGGNPGKISNCYSTGSVSGDWHVGGLVGYSYIGEVSNSFWDIQTSGQPSSDGGTDKTTAEMQMAGIFLDAGWDFVDETVNGAEDIWWIFEGQDYPRLWWELIDEN